MEIGLSARHAPFCSHALNANVGRNYGHTFVTQTDIVSNRGLLRLGPMIKKSAELRNLQEKFTPCFNIFDSLLSPFRAQLP